MKKHHLLLPDCRHSVTSSRASVDNVPGTVAPNHPSLHKLFFCQGFCFSDKASKGYTVISVTAGWGSTSEKGRCGGAECGNQGA